MIVSLITSWDWTEVLEGICVSLLFVLTPLMIRIEKHNKSAKKRHKELMDAHQRHEKAIQKIK